MTTIIFSSSILLIFLFVTCAIFTTVFASTTDKFVELELIQGKLRGREITVEGYPLNVFLGVPYGMPPTGRLRFRPSLLADSWPGVRDATKPGPDCYSIRDDMFPGFQSTEIWFSALPFDEDCLHLNIWAPKDAQNAAVMVYIFGGGFLSGSPTLDIYNGATLATFGGVIVVNINYRLGPFGFLYAGRNTSAPGNMGLYDQQIALKWIHLNIQRFGGDPNKVTLFGESAGSYSVSSHLVAPNSWPYFRNVIMLSGLFTAPWGDRNHETAVKPTMELLHYIGCNQEGVEAKLDCARQKTPDDIMGAFMNISSDASFLQLSFSPVVEDDYFYKGNAVRKLQRGQVKKTPVITGSVLNEGPYFLVTCHPDTFDNVSESLLDRSTYWLYTNDAFKIFFKEPVRKAIAFHYTMQEPPGNGTSAFYRDVLSDSIGDFFFDCPSMAFAKKMTELGANVYAYVFRERSSHNKYPAWMGVMHGYEMDYIFGKPLRHSYPYNPIELDFSTHVMAYLTNFAKYGNPNGPRGDASAPVSASAPLGRFRFPYDPAHPVQFNGSETVILRPWPSYGREQKVLHLQSSSRYMFLVENDPEAEVCNFWREVQPLGIHATLDDDARSQC